MATATAVKPKLNKTESRTHGMKFCSIPIIKLKLNPKNPVTHGDDLKVIVKSLKAFENVAPNGQIAPLIVQRKTNMVIDGNGRLEALRTMNAKEVAICYVDVDDKTAQRMSLAFNKIGANPQWNDYLAVILKEAQESEFDATSLGFSQKEVNDLVGKMADSAAAAMADLEEQMEASGVADASLPEDSKPIVEPMVVPTTALEKEEVPDEAIGGSSNPYTLNANVVFPARNKYGFPDLLPEMLASCPQNIKVWAGEYSDPAEHHFALWKGRSLFGINQQKSILAFYVWDEKFEEVWWDADEFTERMLADKWMCAVTPNFTLLPENPTVERMWQTYRSRWCGRFWQSVGIKIIPDICIVSEQDYEYVLLGIPKGLPCISIQAQSNADESKKLPWIKRTVETLAPKQVILYGGKTDTNIEIGRLLNGSAELIFIESLNNQLNKKLGQRRKAK